MVENALVSHTIKDSHVGRMREEFYEVVHVRMVSQAYYVSAAFTTLNTLQIGGSVDNYEGEV